MEEGRRKEGREGGGGQGQFGAGRPHPRRRPTTPPFFLPKQIVPSWNQHEPQYCGSCYAHATLTQLADRLKIEKGGLGPDVVLSRQSFLNCAPPKNYSGGCDGGDVIDVYGFMKEYGLPDETCVRPCFLGLGVGRGENGRRFVHSSPPPLAPPPPSAHLLRDRLHQVRQARVRLPPRRVLHQLHARQRRRHVLARQNAHPVPGHVVRAGGGQRERARRQRAGAGERAVRAGAGRVLDRDAGGLYVRVQRGRLPGPQELHQGRRGPR